MRMYFSIAVICGLLTAGTVVYAKTDAKAVATVNGEAITYAEYEKAIAAVEGQYRQYTPVAQQSPEKIKELKDKVLDQMVVDVLLKQEAKKKIKVTKAEVDETIKQIKARFGTEQEFQETLKKEDLTASQFRKRVEEQSRVQKLLEQEVKKNVGEPAEADIRSFYDKIVMKIQGGEQKEGAKELKADDAGQDSGATELNEIAKYYGSRLAEQVQARHILIKVENTAAVKEKKAALDKIKGIQKELKGGADFEELAKKYSDDPVSKEKGGMLGYFSRGQMAPEFEKAAFSLHVGHVSEPVLTEYGYHIIKIEGKQAAKKLNYEEAKAELKQYLLQRATTARYETWLWELRSKAVINVNETIEKKP